MTGGNRTRVIVSAVALGVMCVLIFCMSAQPGKESGGLSLAIAQQVAGLFPGYGSLPALDQAALLDRVHFAVRKTAHFTEYAILGMLALNLGWQVVRARSTAPGAGASADGMPDAAAVRKASVRPGAAVGRLGLYAWLFSAAYAASDEVHQLFVSERAGAVADVCIDSAGALTGILLLCLVLHAIDRRRARR